MTAETILIIALTLITLVSLGVTVFVVLRNGKAYNELLDTWSTYAAAANEYQGNLFLQSLQTIKATNAIEAAQAGKIREHAKAEVEAYKTAFNADLKYQEGRAEAEKMAQETARDFRGNEYVLEDLEPLYMAGDE